MKEFQKQSARSLFVGCEQLHEKKPAEKFVGFSYMNKICIHDSEHGMLYCRIIWNWILEKQFLFQQSDVIMRSDRTMLVLERFCQRSTECPCTPYEGGKS